MALKHLLLLRIFMGLLLWPGELARAETLLENSVPSREEDFLSESCFFATSSHQGKLLDQARTELLRSARESAFLKDQEIYHLKRLLDQGVLPGITKPVLRVHKNFYYQFKAVSENLHDLFKSTRPTGSEAILFDKLKELKEKFLTDEALFLRLENEGHYDFSSLRERLKITLADLGQVIDKYISCKNSLIPRLEANARRSVKTRWFYRQFRLLPPPLSLSKSPDTVAILLQIYRSEANHFSDSDEREEYGKVQRALESGDREKAQEAFKDLLQRLRKRNRVVEVNHIIHGLLKESLMQENVVLIHGLSNLDALTVEVIGLRRRLFSLRELMVRCKGQEEDRESCERLRGRLEEQFSKARSEFIKKKEGFLDRYLDMAQAIHQENHISQILDYYDLFYRTSEKLIKKKGRLL